VIAFDLAATYAVGRAVSHMSSEIWESASGNLFRSVLLECLKSVGDVLGK